MSLSVRNERRPFLVVLQDAHVDGLMSKPEVDVYFEGLVFLFVLVNGEYPEPNSSLYYEKVAIGKTEHDIYIESKNGSRILTYYSCIPTTYHNTCFYKEIQPSCYRTLIKRMLETDPEGRINSCKVVELIESIRKMVRILKLS